MKTHTLALVTLVIGACPVYADTTSELIANLKSPEVAVRLEAAEELGKRKAVEAISPLLEVQDQDEDEDHRVRRAAEAALQSMGKKAVSTYLLAQAKPLDKPKFYNILSPLKPDAREALPILEEELKSEWLDIRRRTTLLLGELSGDTKSALPLLFEAAQNPANLEANGSPKGTVCELAIRSAKKIDPSCDVQGSGQSSSLSMPHLVLQPTVSGSVDADRRSDGTDGAATGQGTQLRGLQPGPRRGGPPVCRRPHHSRIPQQRYSCCGLRGKSSRSQSPQRGRRPLAETTPRSRLRRQNPSHKTVAGHRDHGRRILSNTLQTYRRYQAPAA